MPLLLPCMMVLLAISLLVRGGAADRVPAVIVHSLGGNYTPYGRDFAGGVANDRFSNGRLTMDYVSQALGLPPVVPAYLDPSHSMHRLGSGVSFTSAGSGLDDITAQIFSAVTLTQQIEHFKVYKEKLARTKGDAATSYVIARSLYLLSVGASDLLANYLLFPIRCYRFTLLEYEEYLIGTTEAVVRAIYSLGARRVRLPRLPPLGCLPLQRTINHARPRDYNKWHNMVARSFNRMLRAMVRRLNRDLPEVQVVYVDQYRLVGDMIAKPWVYGFENSVRGCCGTGYVETGVLCNLDNALTCENADKYMFFDALHPSERAYKIIANAIVHSASHGLK
ncbi:hypothetical protein SETIT_2G155000v2 [Setaria italica]|uniref:GDSL esterase/lipase n=2 Tax=Setaria italica TaxID=4555 RepID=A0A368PZ60_SETIT|nr:hypothetical protein SETIT_2G155000v2 [Setaria italica]